MQNEIFIPNRKMLVLVGEQASGKSMFAAQIIATNPECKGFTLYSSTPVGHLINAVRDGFDAFVIEEGYPNPYLLNAIFSMLDNRTTYSKKMFFICCCLPDQLPPCAAESKHVKIHYMNGDSNE